MARLELDLADPIAHPGRNAVAGGLGVAGERLGEEADGRERGAQLVRQVVDELGPDLLQATQLGHILEDDPHAADGRTPGPHDERRTVRTTQSKLTGRTAAGPGGRDELLDPAVEEGLERGPAAERARRPAKQDVSRRVGQLDRARLVEADDPDTHQVGEIGRVADLLVELELGRIEPITYPTDEGRQVGRGILPLGLIRGSIGVTVTAERAESEAAPGEGRPGRLERPVPIERDADRDRERDREQPDEADDDPVHRSEDRTGPGRPRYPDRRIGHPAHAPTGVDPAGP